MIDINMFSSADKVAGQGVGAVYDELMALLKRDLSDKYNVKVNKYTKSTISHYHTIDPQFYLSTFSKKRGRKIGFVHFLPDTLDSSLSLPGVARVVLDKYVIAFYKRMDQIVVVNPNFIPKLTAYGIDERKVKYIPNFVSTDSFHPVTPARQLVLRAELGLKQHDFVVFGAGQVQERKGVDDFIQLAERNPDIQFVWAGGFSFGAITNGYSHLKKVVDNPPANLKFTGIVPRDTMINYYNIADVFLLPSYEELFPMAVLEAFASGTPVMVRKLDLYKQIIEPYAMEGSNVDEMEAKIRQLRDSPAARAHYQDLSARATAEYSEQHLAQIWDEFYTQQAALAGQSVSRQ